MSNGPGPGSVRYGAEAGFFEKEAKNFKATLNTKDAEDFENSSFDLVCRELFSLQTQQQATKNLMNMKRLQRFLDGMAALQQVLTRLEFQEVDSIMACIWGPMRFFFKATNINERAFDDILDVYYRLGLSIPRFTDYMHVFRSSQNRIMCLVNTYKDVLEFHSIAYKLFSLRSQLWAKLHRATWKDLNPTFDHISSTLKLHAKCIEDHGSFVQQRIDSGFDDPWRNDANHDRDNECRVYEKTYKESQGDFREREKERKTEQKAKIIKWISALTENDTLHMSFQRKRSCCPENGEWLWQQHDEISNWMREDIPGESTIWIHGPRGMGKTILASHVIDRLKGFAEEDPEVPSDSQVCYFYCQEDDFENNNYLGILRGILHQLVSSAEVPNDGVNPEQNIANNNLAILPLCEDKMTTSGGSTLTNPDVATSLIDVFFENTSRQYVVIDGLEECKATTEITQTINFFTKTVAACEELNQGQLRVMFMSQPNKDIRKCMEKNGLSPNSGEVELDAKENAEDIRKYVRNKLNSPNGDRFNLFEREKQEIEDKIAFMSEGLFLYGHLAVENLLTQLTKAALLDMVKPGMLPRGIKDIYAKLLRTLRARLEEDGTWEVGKQLLGWLICAHRPLKLHEMDAILSFYPDREVVDFDLYKLREGVTDILGSLVQVLPGDNIRLMHSTAKKYLAETDDFDVKSVQCDLATRCLRYLSLRCFVANDYTEAERQEHIVQGYFSFQDYAMSQWYKHIISVLESCRSVFDTDTPHFQNPTAAAFQVALEKFVSSHDKDLKPLPEPDVPSDLDRTYIDTFIDLHSIYPALLRLWNHIYLHQKESAEERNRVGIARLDDTLKSHRAVIEKDFKPDSKTVNNDTMEGYYGPNLFKCSRTLCKFFHHGFNNKKDRDSHQNRHDRPYPCPLEEKCGFAPVGFSSNKDRQRHVRNYHPELSEAPSAFLQMSRRVETAKFECSICKKLFTRNINLKGHERSHFGERPYACSHCGKAFARLNDCRRHERIHTRNRQ
ncbi:Vegetative incompatibility protein HET-E-1 [Colletotrichum siamense]|uniref:Vegetative incompatibility protein HET-E-1 n=1 Tax=Colletotrichum siamense TaxID=690259 RepID=UPI001872CE97|nr:Vegetative incompatibility protein HET-E-1 [Colletotrichum siamense]KAF5517107.1 Vegetative incompatibility protein HET-E-1 [Colletotrichum siamense]